MSSGRTVYS